MKCENGIWMKKKLQEVHQVTGKRITDTIKKKTITIFLPPHRTDNNRLTKTILNVALSHKHPNNWLVEINKQRQKNGINEEKTTQNKTLIDEHKFKQDGQKNAKGNADKGSTEFLFCTK